MTRAAQTKGPNRAVRNLLQLRASSSTSRTLNLVDVFTRHGDTDDYRAAPFFRNQILNRSIIVKHRLRTNELEAFHDPRTGATKVILPIDVTDLKFGARSFFIGQVGYDDILDEVLGGRGEAGGADAALLAIIDQLPSLDPFLMRERLKTCGFQPARCYFDLTDADAANMFSFVRREISPLIGISFENNDRYSESRSTKFAQKILANAADKELEPFRLGLGMDRSSFEEGMFCWKGFIYYKWTLQDILPKVRPIVSEINSVRPTGVTTDDDKAYILGARQRLGRAVVSACETVRLTLKVYEDAYLDLTKNGQPQAFREFLLRAPHLFYELGERLAAVQHIVSFWRFRFPNERRNGIAAEELVDLLADFEYSLNFERIQAGCPPPL